MIIKTQPTEHAPKALPRTLSCLAISASVAMLAGCFGSGEPPAPPPASVLQARDWIEVFYDPNEKSRYYVRLQDMHNKSNPNPAVWVRVNSSAADSADYAVVYMHSTFDCAKESFRTSVVARYRADKTLASIDDYSSIPFPMYAQGAVDFAMLKSVCK